MLTTSNTGIVWHLQSLKSLMPFAATRVPSDAANLESVMLPGAVLQLKRWELATYEGRDVAFMWVATNSQPNSWSHILGVSRGYCREEGVWHNCAPQRVAFKLAPGTTCDLLCALTMPWVTEEDALSHVRAWSFELLPRTESEHNDRACPSVDGGF